MIAGRRAWTVSAPTWVRALGCLSGQWAASIFLAFDLNIYILQIQNSLFFSLLLDFLPITSALAININ